MRVNNVHSTPISRLRCGNSPQQTVIFDSCSCNRGQVSWKTKASGGTGLDMEHIQQGVSVKETQCVGSVGCRSRETDESLFKAPGWRGNIIVPPGSFFAFAFCVIHPLSFAVLGLQLCRTTCRDESHGYGQSNGSPFTRNYGAQPR